MASPVVQEAGAVSNNPGSCLLFPSYNTCDPNTMSIMTVTNTGNEHLWIRLVYIDYRDGIPRDLFFDLDEYDSFTFLDHALFFGSTKGFFYVYVVDDEYSCYEIDADFLIGQEIIIGTQGNAFDTICINAIPFTALDIKNPDGDLYLDGKEFEAAPKSIHFPRFFGQNSLFQSHIFFIGLTGGTYFKTLIDVKVYNDDGRIFSDSVRIMNSGETLDLMEISPATSNEFLLASSHDPDEPLGFNDLVETGSITLTGIEAINIFTGFVLENACIYAFLFERLGPLGYSATLPMQTEDPANYNRGVLWETLKPER